MAWTTWPPGQQGPTYGLGGWRWRGAWNPALVYRYADLVYYQGATWMLTSEGYPGNPQDSGAWTQISIPGADGAPGAVGPQGPEGPQGPTGGYMSTPRTYDVPLTWHPLDLENGWEAGNEAPAWAREADGTIWLRGSVTGPGTNAIIAHLPEQVVPGDTHWWDGIHGGGKILPGDSAVDAGAILAGDPAGDNDLYTSFKAGDGVSGGDGSGGAGGGDGQISEPWWDGPVDYTTATGLRKLYGCVTKEPGIAFPELTPGRPQWGPLLLHFPLGTVPVGTTTDWTPPYPFPNGHLAQQPTDPIVLRSLNDAPFEDISAQLHGFPYDPDDTGPLWTEGKIGLLNWSTLDPSVQAEWGPENRIKLCFHGLGFVFNWFYTGGAS